MKPNLSRWIKSVRDTQVEEITCSECLDQVSQYVDLELASGQAARQMPRVKQHLDQCLVCREEYQVLQELARMEAEGDLPKKEELLERLKRSGK